MFGMVVHKGRLTYMAEQTEYILFLENQIKDILSNSRFMNYKSQLLARKLKAEFQHTYDFSYIWENINVLITASCFLLKRQDENEQAILSLKICAEICENLASIEDYDWDKDYAMIMSALCYDLSGYQSNASCVIKTLYEYFVDNELDDDKIIFQQILLILQNKIPYANFLLRRVSPTSENVFLLKKALISWYQNILNLEDTDFVNEIHEAYKSFLFSNNVYLVKIVQLLEIKIVVSQRRSLYTVLWNNGINLVDPIWRKFLKILANDYYSSQGIKSIDKRISLYELWVSQRKAIEQGLFTKRQNFVVQMPTSAGKTFIAELFLLHKLVECPGKRCLYISPFRALATEKERDFGKILGKIGYSVSSINGGYDQDAFQNVVYDYTDVMVATPEKIDLLSRLDESFFDEIEGVVVDEGHIVGDLSPRAALTEMLISRLKMKKASAPILFISAVMSKENADAYSYWLSGNKNNVLRSTRFPDKEDWEPTRKIIGHLHVQGDNWRVVFSAPSLDYEVLGTSSFISSFLTPDMYGKGFPSKPDSNKLFDKVALTTSLAYKLSENGGVLVFCGTTQFVKHIGNKFIRLHDSIKAIHGNEWNENHSTNSYYFAKKLLGEKNWITECISIGVGVHFGNLPEILRKNVEQDYKSNKLKIILCTNTVCQGVNFPIKYIIVHSLILGYDQKIKKPICLLQRDFENLIGRAGRAGYETEGMIFFVKNTKTDGAFYSEYFVSRKLEEANSIIFEIYSDFLSEKIDENVFIESLSIVLDSELIALISEEDWDADFENVSERLICNSLFGTQCLLNGKEYVKLKNGLKRCFHSIKDKSQTIEKLNTFKKTGLPTDYSIKMFSYVQKHAESLDSLGIKNVLELFLSFMYETDCSSISKEEIIQQSKWMETKNVLLSWINGSSLDDVELYYNMIFDSGSGSLVSNRNSFFKFMSRGVDYLLPWLLSVFTSFIHEVKKDSLSASDVEFLSSMPLFLKYGLNDKIACLARSMGILSRDTALLLSQKANAINEHDFISWLVKLEKEDFESLNLNTFEYANVEDVAHKFNRNKEPVNKIFQVKGTRFNDDYKFASLKVAQWDSVRLVRDIKNIYDTYAVFVVSEKYGTLGYVPSDVSSYYAVEMDVNDKDFYGFVSNLITCDGYNSIEINLYGTSWQP